MMPDDPALQDMDPVLKLWMFEHWIEDHHDTAEQNKHLSYSIGSFVNPRAVSEQLNRENNTHVADDQEFDDLSRQIVQHNERSTKRKRKRRIVNG